MYKILIFPIALNLMENSVGFRDYQMRKNLFIYVKQYSNITGSEYKKYNN